MTKITRLAQLDLNKTYSYADYLTWQLDVAIELIKGKIMLMSPAPNVRHQRIAADLNGILYNFFNDKKCQFFAAPFDVRLYKRKKSGLNNEQAYTVVHRIYVLCVILRFWMNKAVMVHPIGLLRFYLKVMRNTGYAN